MTELILLVEQENVVFSPLGPCCQSPSQMLSIPLSDDHWPGMAISVYRLWVAGAGVVSILAVQGR